MGTFYVQNLCFGMLQQVAGKFH